MQVKDMEKPLHVIKDLPVLTNIAEVDESKHTNGAENVNGAKGIKTT
jgi:hypothetical protein